MSQTAQTQSVHPRVHKLCLQISDTRPFPCLETTLAICTAECIACRGEHLGVRTVAFAHAMSLQRVATIQLYTARLFSTQKGQTRHVQIKKRAEWQIRALRGKGSMDAARGCFV